MIKSKQEHGHMHGSEQMPDPEKIKDILNVVSDRVPELLKKLSDVLYGIDQAKKFGKAAAVFYTELKDTGMSNEQIFELTRQYMASLNIGQMVSGFAKNEEGGQCSSSDFSEEVGAHVRRRIKK